MDVLRSVDLKQQEIHKAQADLNKRKADLLAQAGFTALEEELKQKQANLDGILEKAEAIFKVEIGANGVGAIDGTPVVKGKLTREQGYTGRVVVLHNDVGRTPSGEPLEWHNVEALAREHAEQYGFDFYVRARELGGLWDQLVNERRNWPSSSARWCSVNCTSFTWLIMALYVVIKECGVDLRRQLMEGRVQVPSVGSVATVARIHPPFVVLDRATEQIRPVTEYLEDLALSDSSPLTCRSYAYGLLRWFRLLWLLEVDWERATEADVAAMVGWLRSAPNPQRRRRVPGAPEPGSVNLRTGKPTLARGYAKRTINHALSVVSGFYEFHGHRGHGPVINPVPSSPQRRRALSHLSPLEPKPVVGRARLRQKVPDRPPRAIPDRLWDELFEAMGCERDRALLEFSVSSGARAAELLGVTPEDIDWAGRQIFVISKGTRLRQPVPASPQAFVRLALYLDEVGTLKPGESIWRVRRGDDRPLSYWALRRIMQRGEPSAGHQLDLA
ncbi:site-specific integrase [Nonomuraea sp. NPDC049141]|uniref:site-specific integrase n=1 Tax=Nonomuraea sp. NPDC049141 TaxID=3155500 RepID=UPI0033C0121F